MLAGGGATMLSSSPPLPPPSSVNGAGASADGAMDYGIVVVHVDKAQALAGPETCFLR